MLTPLYANSPEYALFWKLFAKNLGKRQPEVLYVSLNVNGTSVDVKELLSSLMADREKARTLAEDWHEGVPSDEIYSWACKAAGTLLKLSQTT